MVLLPLTEQTICYVTKDTDQSMTSVRAATRSPFSHDWLHQRQVLWKQNTDHSGGPRPHVKAGALCPCPAGKCLKPRPQTLLFPSGCQAGLKPLLSTSGGTQAEPSLLGSDQELSGHSESCTSRARWQPQLPTRTSGSTASGNVQSFFRNLTLHRHSPVHLLLSSLGPWKVVLENCRGFPLAWHLGG